MKASINSGQSLTGIMKLSFKRKLYLNRYLLILIAPVLIYYLIFAYLPMFGLVIAFENYSPFLGVFKSPWVGFQNFARFFSSPFFLRVFINTFSINFWNLLFGFPAPIILALLLNEIRHKFYKRTVQTITYMPHFISMVVIVGIMNDILSPDYGIVNRIIILLGGSQIRFMTEPQWFQPLYVISGIWQGIGWGSIIYLAAIDGIDQQQYEAAVIDGANRLEKIWFITIPGISTTILMLFIIQIGNMMNVGFEKVLLMYNSSTMPKADVISTYVYRMGLISGDFGFGAAVGLFNSAINFALLIAVNTISRKVSNKGLF